jgi:HPt (histidine-containing phosphotransfer) domain-containing protein
MSEQLATAEPAIDPAHLRRMTAGDAALEREVLSLFHAHSALLIEKMRDGDPAAMPALAHTLKGSALGIGADAVARSADALQRMPADKAALDAVEKAVEAARDAIAGMLARSGE